LAGCGWQVPAIHEFAAARGWSDPFDREIGFDSEIGRGHHVMPLDPEDQDLEQTGLWLAFCYASRDPATAELGTPDLESLRVESNIAAWRVGSALVVLGQTQDEYLSQGDVDLGAVWLFPHPADEGLPDEDDLRDWLCDGKEQ